MCAGKLNVMEEMTFCKTTAQKNRKSAKKFEERRISKHYSGRTVLLNVQEVRAARSVTSNCKVLSSDSKKGRAPTLQVSSQLRFRGTRRYLSSNAGHKSYVIKCFPFFIMRRLPSRDSSLQQDNDLPNFYIASLKHLSHLQFKQHLVVEIPQQPKSVTQTNDWPSSGDQTTFTHTNVPKGQQHN